MKQSNDTMLLSFLDFFLQCLNSKYSDTLQKSFQTIPGKCHNHEASLPDAQKEGENKSILLRVDMSKTVG